MRDAMEEAAMQVLREAGAEVLPGEPPLTALGYAFGNEIPYEVGLRRFGEIIQRGHENAGK